MTPAEVADYVTESRAGQGLSPHVEDETALIAVATLLGSEPPAARDAA